MSSQLTLLFGFAALAVWGVQRWRAGVKLALVLLVFEGAIRKWILPSSQQYVYFLKDIVLLSSYAGALLNAPRMIRRVPKVPQLNALLLAGSLYGLLEVLNPSSPSILVGLLGFKSYFLYVPLLLLVPASFRDAGELERFLRWYAMLAIPVGALAAYQFRSPAASVVNVYAWSPEAGGPVVTFGTSAAVRVTGTFSFITGYATYTLVSAILILSLLSLGRWRLRHNLPLVAALASTLGGMLMTGSRGPVVTLAFLLPVYLWFAILRERGGGATLGRMLLLLAIAGVFGGQALAPAAEAFFARAAAASDAPSRMTGPFLDPVRAFPTGGFFGLGIGSTHQAATHLVGERTVISPFDAPSFEGESGRVVVEVGLIGFVLLYLPRLVLIIIAIRYARSLRYRYSRLLATASLLVLLMSLPGGIIFNVTAGVYYWFFAGLLMLAVRLDREAAFTALRAGERDGLAGAGSGLGR